MDNRNYKYINTIISFDYYHSSYYAMCVGISKEGKLICYRAKRKENSKTPREIPMEDANGNALGYTIEYMCKFTIHPGCARKILLNCETDFVQKINALYMQLQPLEELVKRYKELKFQYYHTHRQESKSILQQMAQLSYEIDARQAFFLRHRAVKKGNNGKYRNYKTVPNKNGITRIYKGGDCSGK